MLLTREELTESKTEIIPPGFKLSCDPVTIGYYYVCKCCGNSDIEPRHLIHKPDCHRIHNTRLYGIN